MQREIAADQIEQERRDLGEEIVDEFDQELPLVDVVPDLEDAPEPRGDVGAFVVRRIVDVDGANAVDDFADPSGQFACGELAFAAENQSVAAASSE